MSRERGRLVRAGFLTALGLLAASAIAHISRPGPIPGGSIFLFLGLSAVLYGLDMLVDFGGSFYLRMAPESVRNLERSHARIKGWLAVAAGVAFGLLGLFTAASGLAKP